MEAQVAAICWSRIVLGAAIAALLGCTPTHVAPTGELGMSASYAYPVGPAAGGLAGTYPNPSIDAGAVNMGGDVTGTAANDKVVKIQTIAVASTLPTGG